jgi:2-keto-3-deoxy-L-rhamnonate aldolase RhmA
MRNSKTLKKIHQNRCARVCGLGHYLPFFVRYAAHFGYDVIWLDLEHRAMTDREVQSLLGLCHHNDIDCMVRPPTQERTRLYRYFEDGATGLMMPLVSDAEDAQHIVNAVKFPPEGNRGMDGAGLDGDFGLEVWNPDSTYTDDANRETFIAVQIETPEALENVEEIAAVPGVDALFVGPGDLGLRLNHSEGEGQLSLDEAIAQVADAAKRHGIAWGIPAGTPELIKQYRAMGAQLLAYGGDFALTGVLESSIQDFDKALGE